MTVPWNGHRHGRRVATRALAVLSLLAAMCVAGPLEQAVAAPGISLSKSGSGQVRAGEPITYTLTASNPATNPDAVPEFNLSYADTLPPGLTYVPGSTTPARAGEPTVSTDPDTGQQTLVWANIADVVVDGTFTITFQAVPDPDVYPVGSTVTNPQATVYADTDPQESPRFASDGTPIPGTFTESGTSGGASTLVTAIELTKSEGSPEGELLRGVHDHPTVYTLTVTGGAAAGSSGLTLVDYLPDNLEFLGCGGVDNSSAPEYPGAASLTATPTPSSCQEPDSVTTVQDPPPNGSVTYPPGVYTRVEWALPAIAAGATQTIRYAAGAPLNANTMWPDPAPTGLDQVANLDNNTGPSTRETTTEQSATNTAVITGTYEGPVEDGASTDILVSADETVTLEDVRMRKTVAPTTFSAGDIATYTLTIDTSEYVSADDIVITDVIPYGVCPLGGNGTNYAGGTPPDCDGSAATAPSVPYDTVTQNADGTFTVVFDPLTATDDDTLTVTYSGAMLPFYLDGPREGDPTTTGDAFTNTASLEATTTPVPDSPETGTEDVADDTSATQRTGGVELAKGMLPRPATGGTCPTDTSGYRTDAQLTDADRRFRLGDVVCFALAVAFPTTSETRNATVVDFLPSGLEYVAGSAQPGDDSSNAPYTLQESSTAVGFLLGEPAGGNPRYVQPGAAFEAVLQARVTEPSLLPTGETRTNQMKLVGETSDGTSVTYRRSVDLTVTGAPQITTVKGVASVDAPASGPNGVNSDVDGSLVQGGSVATFRIDLTNAGTGPTAYEAGGFEVWDVLPVGIACSRVSNVRTNPVAAPAPGVACTDPGAPGQPNFNGSGNHSLLRITLSSGAPGTLGHPIDPGETLSVLYDMSIPTPAGVSTVYPNTASVHSYQTATDDDTTAVHYPRDNIDNSLPDEVQDAPASSDDSSVVTAGPVVAKTGTTSITETGNNAPSQATIGEQATYTYSVTIPAHTAVFSGSLTDTLPTGFVAVPPAALTFFPDAAAGGTAATPSGVTLNPATGAVTFPETYENTTNTDQRFQVTLTARVTSSALPTGQNNVTRTNEARFTSLREPGGSALPTLTATYPLTLRQPTPAISKTNDHPSATGGETIAYTVTASNTSASGTPLHDAFVVDCLPAGLAFDAYGPNPGQTPGAGDGTNGCVTGTTRLVWNLGDLAPAASVTRTYTAVLSTAAVGGTSYTNTATLTGSTLDDDKTDPGAADNPNERAYAVSAPSTTVVTGAQTTKSVTPDRATIGESVTWTVIGSIPPNTVFYDGALLDDYPDGIGDRQLQSVTCVVLSSPTAPCATPLPMTPLTPVDQGSSTLQGFYLGDAPSIPFERRLTFVYTGVVEDDPVNVAGRTATNTAQVVWNTTDGSTPTAADFPFDVRPAGASATVTVLEPDLSLDKVVDDATPGPGDTFTYTLTIANSAAADASRAYNLGFSDVVPAGVVVDPASISDGGTISGADPATGGGTITWPDPTDGAGLAVGDSLELSYDAQLAPSALLNDAPLTNTATVTGYASLPSDGREYSGPADTATIDPAFPELTTVKDAVDPSPAYIADPFTWRVTVTNTGDATAYGVDVGDQLPTGWQYVAGSARGSVADGPVVAREPAIVPTNRLVWTNVGVLPPNTSAVVTFQARPTSSVIDNPGVGSTVPQVNSAVAAGEDATGATGNADGPYGGVADTAQTRIDSADLTVVKDHTDPVVAGGQAVWTVTVHNDGPDAAVGPFSVTDTLPDGVTYSSATGPGWTCSQAAGEITCTRSDPDESLANGADLPVITVVTDVPDDTASGTTLTNEASATDRTYDPDLNNNTDSDPATVTTEADLQVTKAHAGNLVPGRRAVWTIDVQNNGPSVSLPDIVVTDTLPDGVTYVSASGTGWSCTGAAQVVTCTRSTALPIGPAPQISVTGAIDPDVTGDLTNTAVVDGVTPDPVPENNTDTDTDGAGPVADLAIEKSHEGSFVAGSTGTYHFEIVNHGPSDAAAPVTITDTLPDVLTYTGFADVTGTWGCSASGQDVTCTLDGDLPAGDDAAVDLTVDVAADAPAEPILNSATVSSPTTDPLPFNNTDDDNTDVDQISDLQVTKSHTGTAVAGENFAWQVVVRNNGSSDNGTEITVADILPAGTTYVSATGTGWTCSASGRTVTCTYAAGLLNGEGAPPITVTVAISPAAGPDVLVNSAAVDSELTDDDLTNNADQDPTEVVDQADVEIAKSVAGSTSVAAGAEVTYELVATNNGPSDADRVLVTDVFPAGVTPADVDAPTGWTCAITGQRVTCLHGTAPAGASQTLTVTAEVDPAVPAGTELTNTATIATSTDGDDPANNTDEATITTTVNADLELTKSHNPIPGGAHSGGRVTFVIDVHNNGPSQAEVPLTVTDTLPTGFSYVSAAAPWVCSAPAPGTEVTCTYDPGAPFAPDADAPTLTLTTAIGPDAPAATYVNHAEVTSPSPDEDTSNNADDDSVPVTPAADVSVQKSHLGEARIGDQLVFSILVANAGPSSAADVVVTDALPRGLDLISAGGDGWTCTTLGNALRCTLDDPLPRLSRAAPIEVVSLVGPQAYPSVRNVARVQTSTDGDDPDDNVATDPVDVPPQVDLSVIKTHEGDFVVGDPATWTLDVANAGPTDDPGPVTVTDTLPSGVTFGSASGDGWECSAAGQTVTCVAADGLAAGASSQITLDVVVKASAYPSVVNSAAVTSPAEDVDPDNNTDTDPADVTPVSVLSITKDVLAQNEDEVTFGITVHNTGPNTTTAPIVVTDPLPSGLELVSAAGAGWVCSNAGQTLTCTYAAAVAVGADTSQLTVATRYTADGPAPGDEIENVAEASGGNIVACPECGDTDAATAVRPALLPSDGGTTQPTLARTGTDVAAPLIVAMLLLTAGTALSLGVRRVRGRRRTAPGPDTR